MALKVVNAYSSQLAAFSNKKHQDRLNSIYSPMPKRTKNPIVYQPIMPSVDLGTDDPTFKSLIVEAGFNLLPEFNLKHPMQQMHVQNQLAKYNAVNGTSFNHINDLLTIPRQKLITNKVNLQMFNRTETYIDKNYNIDQARLKNATDAVEMQRKQQQMAADQIVRDTTNAHRVAYNTHIQDQLHQAKVQDFVEKRARNHLGKLAQKHKHTQNVIKQKASDEQSRQHEVMFALEQYNKHASPLERAQFKKMTKAESSALGLLQRKENKKIKHMAKTIFVSGHISD
jgi:hypothetical protein